VAVGTSTVLMTGAGRGIGRIAAEQVLRARPDVRLVVTAREGGGPALAAGLAAATGNPNVSVVSCDLASMASIQRAVGEIGARLDAGDLPPLSGFAGNAGVQLTTRTRATEDGIEPTFAVNVLANYLFVRLLWDRFTAPGRIVVVGSDTHFGDLRHNLGLVPAPRWESVRELATPREGEKADTAREGRAAYSTSKLAVAYLVHALARRLPSGVDVYSFNPGYVPATGLFRDAGPAVRFLSRTLMRAFTATPFAHSPVTSGAMLAKAVAGPRPGETGAYIDRDAVVPSSAESYDHAREEELWATAAQLCALPVEAG
jgi:NAD(P)-dependent dehydrogenase (short-subunit alcohol dehydrogenase family)